MKYLCLIYQDEAGLDQVPAEQFARVYREYMALTESIQQSGHWVGGHALHPTATATTVRVREGGIVTTDGPFAETKEQLGGYYLVEARDLNEAIQIAARIPGARWGSVEVRPIREFPRPT
jgi:hypothetical protein